MESNMSISVREVLDNELMSEGTLRGIPTRCKCGAPMVFNDSLRNIQCSNKKCKYKLVSRIKRFAKITNINIDDSIALELIQYLGIVTPYQILMIDQVVEANKQSVRNIHNILEIANGIKKYKSTKHKIYEVAALCGISTIENIAKQLFEGFNSLDDVYNELDKCQVSYISDRLGIHNNDCAQFSVDIYNKLIELKDEMMFGEAQLEIDEYPNKMDIVITDNVLPFINKSEYIEFLNSKYNICFNMTTSVSDNTDILISNSTPASNKMHSATVINNRYVANEMNQNKLNLSDINKKVDGELKPLGVKVLICTSNELETRLNELEAHDGGK
jgi:hypothetical protein